ncbi:MAG: hypothetical protein ACRC0G_07600 [Fusobacteriaceae bacterium]
MFIRKDGTVRGACIDTLRFNLTTDAQMEEVLVKAFKKYKGFSSKSNTIGISREMFLYPKTIVSTIKYTKASLGIKGISLEYNRTLNKPEFGDLCEYGISVNIMELLSSLRKTRDKAESSRHLMDEIFNCTIINKFMTCAHILQVYEYKSHVIESAVDSIYSDILNNPLLDEGVDFTNVSSDYIFWYVSSVINCIFSLAGLYVRSIEFESVLLSINVKEKNDSKELAHPYHRVITAINMFETLSNIDSAELGIGGLSVSINRTNRNKILRDTLPKSFLIEDDSVSSRCILTQKIIGNGEVTLVYALYPNDIRKNDTPVDSDEKLYDAPLICRNLHGFIYPGHKMKDSDDPIADEDGVLNFNIFMNIKKYLKNIDKINEEERSKVSYTDYSEEDEMLLSDIVKRHIYLDPDIPSLVMGSTDLTKNKNQNFIFEFYKNSLLQICNMNKMPYKNRAFRVFTQALQFCIHITFHEKLDMVLNNPKVISNIYPTLAILNLKEYVSDSMDSQSIITHKNILVYLKYMNKRFPKLPHPEITEGNTYLTIRDIIDFVQYTFKDLGDGVYIEEISEVLKLVVLNSKRKLYMAPVTGNLAKYWSHALFTQLFDIGDIDLTDHVTPVADITRTIKKKYYESIMHTFDPMSAECIKGSDVLDPVGSCKLLKCILDAAIYSTNYKYFRSYDIISRL